MFGRGRGEESQNLDPLAGGSVPGRWLVCVSGSLVGGGVFVCRLLHKSISVSGVGGLCVCTRVGVFLGSMGVSVPATAHMMDGGEEVVGRSLVFRTPGGVMAVYMGGLSRECWFLGEEESIFDPMVRNFHILRWGWDGEWGKWTVGVPPAVSDKVPPYRCQESQALPLLAKSPPGCLSLPLFPALSHAVWVFGAAGQPPAAFRKCECGRVPPR